MMPLTNLFTPKDRPMPEPVALASPQSALCCQKSQFVPYAPITGYEFNGQSCAERQVGKIVACTHCGEVWAVAEHGLYRPNPECLPGPLALQQAKRSAERGRDTRQPPPPKRGGIIGEYNTGAGVP